MRSKNSFRIFTGAYSLARSAGLLDNPLAKRAFVSSYFFYKKFWEDPFLNLIRREPHLFQGGDILDIGANIGYTSCLFAQAIESGSKVYSFEPDETNFQMLSDVIRRKNLPDRIVALHSAVGAADGSVKIWHNENHSGDHRVVTEHFKDQLSDSSRVATVPMVSVDSFAAARNLRKISFIKIDVQGYELAVCDGMRKTLAAFPDLAVCCEYSPEGIAELGFDPVELLNYFRTNGFHIHILTRSSTTLAPDDAAIQREVEKAGYVDLLCSRRILT
jgi:FkbM family methyltransferase